MSTASAEDDRCAVAGALTDYGAEFAYRVGPFLQAIAHGDSLLVARSPLIVRDDDQVYRAVWDYIERRRLVLADRRTFNLAPPDCSLCELSWWMSRELLRDGLAAYGPSPLAELGREMSR